MWKIHRKYTYTLNYDNILYGFTTPVKCMLEVRSMGVDLYVSV